MSAQTYARKWLPAFALLLAMLAALEIVLTGRSLDLNRSVFDMGFGFGVVTENLIHLHRLGAPDPVFGWWSYAIRMPFIPLFAALVSTVFSSSLRTLFIVKNGLSWFAWIYALLRLRKHYRIPDRWVLLAAALVLVVPYNVSTGSQVENEEGYLLAMLGLLFALLLTSRAAWGYCMIGALIAAAYLTKSSMLFVCVAASVWAAVAAWKINRAMAFIPALALAFAIGSWGAYIYVNTGVFAVGTDASSWNGRNFYKGSGPLAYSLYPRSSLDLLDQTGDLIPSLPVHNEWDLSHAQLALGREYARSHPDIILKLDAKKLFVACCDLKESPENTPGHTRILIVVSNLVNHLLLAAVFLYAIRNALQGKIRDAEVLFLIFVAAYLMPYMAAFLYMRHMMPIYGLAAFTLAIQQSNRRNKKASVTF